MAIVGLCLIIGAGVLVGGVFAIEPSFDLQVARYFTRQDVKDFLAEAHPFLDALRFFNFQLTILLLFLSFGAIAAKMLRPSMAMVLPARISIFVILVFALGPGLLVNGLLKEFWSRPRPRALFEFGGSHHFMAWWDPGGTCIKNCSFVSGEASSAFAVLALAALAPSPLRYLSIGLAIAYGASVSFIRVAVGAHFLSDVLFAGIFTALVVWLLHSLFWRWKRTTMSEQAGTRMIGGAAQNLTAILAAAIAGLKVLMRNSTVWKSWKPARPLAAAEVVGPAGSSHRQ